VIIGEFFGVELTPTVLALVAVPDIDVLPGKLDRAFGPFDHPKKSNDGGQLDGKADRVDIPAVLLDNFDFAKA